MKLEQVEQIAKAVLYEGYMLYPYRPSSVKNRQRFNFGVLYPQDYSAAQEGSELFRMQTECLIQGDGQSKFEAQVRFLHLRTKLAEPAESCSPIPGSRNFGQSGGTPEWQEAVERAVNVAETTLEELCRTTYRQSFAFPEPATGPDEAHIGEIEGAIDASASEIEENLFRIRVAIQNTTSLPAQGSDRHAALMQSFVSTHAILGVNGGSFVSLLDPADEHKQAAASCEHVGLWPVLVGAPGERDTMLSSPIILYDYPQIAPESSGDLFDGTEIDEILSLRIMTLTDDEKREIRQSDERARQILERTEAMPAEQFMKLHGAMRNLRPLKENAS